MRDRFQILREYCQGRSVLDVGTIGTLDHHLRENDKWVFWHLQEVAREVVGIDLEHVGVERMHRLGISNIVCGNAETYQFGKTFEVVVAGEIIEHVDNPGFFLDNMSAHLEPNGFLIITTPNTFSINNILRAFLFAHAPLFHEHVNAYTPDLLKEIFHRHRFALEKVFFYTESPQDGEVSVRWKNVILRTFTTLRPRWGEGMLVVARRMEL